MAKRTSRTFRIHSQLVYDRDGSGHRFSGGKVKWGKIVTWYSTNNNATNFREAVLYAVNRLNRHHVGSVISIRQYNDGRPTRNVTKLFVAKWGHDNQPFTRFYDAIGNWWKRQAGL